MMFFFFNQMIFPFPEVYSQVSCFLLARVQGKNEITACKIQILKQKVMEVEGNMIFQLGGF